MEDLNKLVSFLIYYYLIVVLEYVLYLFSPASEEVIEWLI